MKPADALVEWLRIGAAMQEADPAGFAAIVEQAAQMAGLRTEAPRPAARHRGWPGLSVLSGGRR